MKPDPFELLKNMPDLINMSRNLGKNFGDNLQARTPEARNRLLSCLAHNKHRQFIVSLGVNLGYSKRLMTE